MNVQTRHSRRGPHVEDIYIDGTFVGIIKPHHSGRLVAVAKDGRASRGLFATVAGATEWLQQYDMVSK